MCTLGFQGKGYSLPFIENYESIVEQINQEPSTPINVTFGLDSICRACPHQTDEDTCQQQAFIEQLDQAHLKALNLKAGQSLTWAEAKARIKARITIEYFHQICAGCEWKAYGICETALKNLQNSTLLIDSQNNLSIKEKT